MPLPPQLPPASRWRLHLPKRHECWASWHPCRASARRWRRRRQQQRGWCRPGKAAPAPALERLPPAAASSRTPLQLPATLWRTAAAGNGSSRRRRNSRGSSGRAPGSNRPCGRRCGRPALPAGPSNRRCHPPRAARAAAAAGAARAASNSPRCSGSRSKSRWCLQTRVRGAWGGFVAGCVDGAG